MGNSCSEVEKEGVGAGLFKETHASVGDPVHVLNSDLIESQEAGVVVIKAVSEVEAYLNHSLACVVMIGNELSFVGRILGTTFKVFKPLQASYFYDMIFTSHSSCVTGSFQQSG